MRGIVLCETEHIFVEVIEFCKPCRTLPHRGMQKKTKNETNEREMEEREGKGSADGGSGGVRATRYVMLDVLAS